MSTTETTVQLLNRRDAITSRIATYRQPGQPIRPEDREELEEVMAEIHRRETEQSWEMTPEAAERNAKFAAFANSAQGRAQERVCIKRALRAAGVEIPASILGDAAALRELAEARGVTPYTWEQVKARNAHFPSPIASLAGWDVAEPGPEQVPAHLRGHVAALSPTYWTLFDNGRPRGSHLFFRLAEREARP